MDVQSCVCCFVQNWRNGVTVCEGHGTVYGTKADVFFGVKKLTRSVRGLPRSFWVEHIRERLCFCHVKRLGIWDRLSELRHRNWIA